MPLDGSAYDSQLVGTMDQIIDLLATPDHWCKGVLSDGNRWCIVGAMQEVGGASILRRPILDAIAEITGRHYRQIEAFNDARTTTHPLVLQVLLRAREKIAKCEVDYVTPSRQRGFCKKLATVVRGLVCRYSN